MADIYPVRKLASSICLQGRLTGQKAGKLCIKRNPHKCFSDASASWLKKENEFEACGVMEVSFLER